MKERMHERSCFPASNFSKQEHESATDEMCASYQYQFTYFIENTRPIEKQPVFLILDIHYTHVRNIYVIDKANHIRLKLHLMIETFMGPLKIYFSEEVTQCIIRSVAAYGITKLFGKIYLKVQNAEIAANGYLKEGIYMSSK